MKIYTKTGDGGQTGLIGGRRVDKHDARIEACGGLDELNAAVGWAKVPLGDTLLRDVLRSVQSDLFAIGAELATDDGATPPARLPDDAVRRIEDALDDAWGRAPELRHFVLPGGGEGAARLHLARAVCRRAERAVVAWNALRPVSADILSYLNRLSDLLFAFARLANSVDGIDESLWPPGERSG